MTPTGGGLGIRGLHSWFMGLAQGKGLLGAGFKAYGFPGFTVLGFRVKVLRCSVWAREGILSQGFRFGA